MALLAGRDSAGLLWDNACLPEHRREEVTKMCRPSSFCRMVLVCIEWHLLEANTPDYYGPDEDLRIRA